MLEFFRRYQKAFFIVITVVIVVSFSFFGTFQAIHGRDVEDSVAFTAIDGSKVLSSEVNDLIAFLTQDSSDALISGRPVAANGLNDGVIANDFIQTGLAQVIAASYLQEIAQEEQVKLQREKRYRPYEHPKAPFLSAKQIWTYYAPDLAKFLSQLQAVPEANTMQAFNVRMGLFMAQRQFPPAYLKHFLRYQESMHKWLTPDANLPNYDFSLFGYSSSQDWFGRRFVELVAQFIINSAKYAESRGYTISKDEALASLFKNCETSFNERSAQGMLGSKGPSEYFQEQLRYLTMDQGRVVSVWSQVLLFRRLFYDNADSILASGMGFENFYKHINEYVDIDLYQLPQFLRLSSLKDLQKCQLYHNAVRANKQPGPFFILPKQLLTAAEVKLHFPELVERAFHLRWKQADKEQLQMKVGVKQMWKWQTSDENWQQLVAKYPELGSDKNKSATEDERLALLDSLDPARRVMVDTFSRQEIVNANGQWLTEALQTAPEKEELVLIRQEGGKLPFIGISDRAKFIEALSNAKELDCYSQDSVHYYTIQVLDADAQEVVLSYEKADSDKTLDALLEKTLEKNKDAFTLFLQELDVQTAIAKEKYPALTNWNDQVKARIATYFLPYVQQVKNNLAEKPEESEQWVTADTQSSDIAAVGSYKLWFTKERLIRKDKEYAVDPSVAFSLAVQECSPLTIWEKNGLSFYTVVSKGFLPSSSAVRQKVIEARTLLGNDAICELGQRLLEKMQLPKQKQAQVGISNDDRAGNTPTPFKENV